MLASQCTSLSGKFTNSCVDAGCDNWFCSLRLNCGCFAGVDTSCRSNNLSSTAKPGCHLLLEQFTTPQLGCSFEKYLGSRPNASMFAQYTDQCLAGCSSDASGPLRAGWVPFRLGRRLPPSSSLSFVAFCAALVHVVVVVAFA